MKTMEVDVAIVGGGPAGSTTGAFLAKHNPDLKVAIFERETFPRDHVGESQLPAIGAILHEMGAWDKVEAANFPIKIGATFRWGKSKELWFFDFLGEEFQDLPRPSKFEGQRQFTALQVDRAVYDKILLDHAESLGCNVYQGTKIAKVHRQGDAVTSLELDSGEQVTARYYLDCSGHTGTIRRAMGIQSDYPSNLQNVAFWDYWQDAKWAESIGNGGTRVQVMSLSYGWIWFIPISPTRTSIGLITPAAYYKECGLRPEQLYAQAIQEEERIADLIKDAKRENKFATTKDWSFVARRQYGDNWFLVGESSGFADPVLAAGLSITHVAGREAAFTILELDRGEQDPAWLKETYERRLIKRVTNHIRFADFWYTANSQFSDLKEHTRKIAEMNGLDLEPDKAWRWLAQGGFIDEDLFIGTGGIKIAGIRDFAGFLYEETPNSPLNKNNVFTLNLEGASWYPRAVYSGGRVLQEPGYLRGKNLLPLTGVFEVWVHILEKESRITEILKIWQSLSVANSGNEDFRKRYIMESSMALDAMIEDGWVEASYDPSLPLVPMKIRHGSHKWVSGKEGTDA
jgi:flavin-dependent dehydrogenase